MMATGLSLKKVIKQTGRPVRLVPNKEIELNSASVLHNNLVGPSGLELVLVRDGKRTLVAQTMQVQDIDSYTVRDRERPKRDARVGMLPPKLAQIIINLAAADTDLLKGVYLLDPFCGTGVLLQEAALMGIDVYGTDLEPRMIEYSDANLQWLLTLPENRVTPHSADGKYYRLEVGDATDYTWSPVPDTVACETYLGRPFTDLPTPEVLNQTISECNLIIKKFLTNIHGQLARGTRLCLAVPAWQVRRNQFRHLPFLENQDSSALDPLRNLGYNRISFEHARNEELIYYRADQIVARELLVLQKI
jgi:tRNA G10  N-methylase Trm11